MTSAPSLKLDPKTVARMLTDDGTMATCLQIIALSAYGEEVYQVDPIELVMRLEEDFEAKLTEDNENKLKAILLATSTDIFYEDAEAFQAIGNTLLNGDPGINAMDPLTIPEMLWAVYEVELNHGPQEVTSSVQRVMDQVMSGEMTDADGDPVMEQDPYAYVWAFMTELHNRLKDQLSSLGVPSEALPPIQTPEMLPQGQAV